MEFNISLVQFHTKRVCMHMCVYAGSLFSACVVVAVLESKTIAFTIKAI